MKNKPKNIKEFQALVARYETITLEEIQVASTDKHFIKGNCFNDVANTCTGLGKKSSCILCIAVRNDEECDTDCPQCIYKSYIGCTEGLNDETYHAMHYAENAEQLFKAYRERAKHLRRTYPQYLGSNKLKVFIKKFFQPWK